MKIKISATRIHDISCGHTVTNHESQCAHLHGHNYRFHLTCVGPKLDDVGRVIDFGEIKLRLCSWLDRNWDHRFLIWRNDLRAMKLKEIDSQVVLVNFNPTAENIAQYFLEDIAPGLLLETKVRLVSCKIEETLKCSATVEEEDIEYSIQETRYNDATFGRTLP